MTYEKAPDYYLVSELADKLRVNRMTLYRYIKAGRLPAHKTGKDYRIARSDFEGFMRASKNK